ncbi:Uncharacterised protein [Klebsiella pneumoniae]|nr:hypothetical protein AI2878V1_0812 [Klebsiella pneumoniae]CAH5084522.1 hypothetical protein AI2878V1_0812 [Klebsiella pneumoniae]VAS64628.1 Uncharacterised protein [Klebsiella pneumoniae]
MALTGIPSGSRTKKPASNSSSTPQPVRNVAGSFIAVAGAFSNAISQAGGISLRKNRCSIARVVRIAARSTGTITEAYSLKPMAKKSAETIFTRFDTTSGRLAVSAINPAAMTKASIVPLLNPSARSMAITIGVRISAAPSLANSAATAAPSRIIQVNSRRPRPLPQRETCSAAHSKKPDSSSSRLIMITAIKVAVAFQTICHTTGISATCTPPVASASAAPNAALQPIPNPRGCQITSTRVRIKIVPASNIVPPPITFEKSYMLR